jgi:MFS family permease
VAAGPLAGRLIGRFGSRNVLAVGLSVQGLATLPMVFMGDSRTSLLILVPALFVGFFGHVSSIVAYTVTATSGLPDGEQGLASGLTSMTQQVAITIGIPILSAVAATQGALLAGYHLALSVDVLVTLVSAGLIWTGLRTRQAPAARQPELELAGCAE